MGCLGHDQFVIRSVIDVIDLLQNRGILNRPIHRNRAGTWPIWPSSLLVLLRENLRKSDDHLPGDWNHHGNLLFGAGIRVTPWDSMATGFVDHEAIEWLYINEEHGCTIEFRVPIFCRWDHRPKYFRLEIPAESFWGDHDWCAVTVILLLQVFDTPFTPRSWKENWQIDKTPSYAYVINGHFVWFFPHFPTKETFQEGAASSVLHPTDLQFTMPGSLPFRHGS